MLTTFGTVRDDLSDKLLANNTAQDAARAATIDKNFERENGEEQVRTFRALLKANGVTDAGQRIIDNGLWKVMKTQKKPGFKKDLRSFDLPSAPI